MTGTAVAGGLLRPRRYEAVARQDGLDGLAANRAARNASTGQQLEVARSRDRRPARSPAGGEDPVVRRRLPRPVRLEPATGDEYRLSAGRAPPRGRPLPP